MRDKTIDHCKKLANIKKNEIKKLENELKYLEELSNTSTYCYEFAVTRNRVCLLFEILREFSRVLCKQNHLTTG